MQIAKIVSGQPALVIAPMEGVTDAPMRSLLTARGGFSFCVSEFLRVNRDLYPPHVFFEHIPELKNSCQTPSGTPIQVQILGGHEESMASNAERAYSLGATAIDLNFGCPAPTVNRNDGGASLLRFPSRIQSLVAAVRAVLPAHVPVSAKLRLGWESKADIHTNAEQARLGGASWITIHARTRMQGYAPPVDWKLIGEVKQNLDIPVVANGDICTLDDFKRCRDQTGTEHYMLGRGALANPSLVHEIARELGMPIPAASRRFTQSLEDWDQILTQFVEHAGPYAPHSHYVLCRMKQWVRYAATQNSLPWFNDAKRAQVLPEFFAVLRRS